MVCRQRKEIHRFLNAKQFRLCRFKYLKLLEWVDMRPRKLLKSEFQTLEKCANMYNGFIVENKCFP